MDRWRRMGLRRGSLPTPCNKKPRYAPGFLYPLYRKIGRNALTGRFTTVQTATSKPSTHVVETIKPPKK